MDPTHRISRITRSPHPRTTRTDLVSAFHARERDAHVGGWHGPTGLRRVLRHVPFLGVLCQTGPVIPIDPTPRAVEQPDMPTLWDATSATERSRIVAPYSKTRSGWTMPLRTQDECRPRRKTQAEAGSYLRSVFSGSRLAHVDDSMHRPSQFPCRGASPRPEDAQGPVRAARSPFLPRRHARAHRASAFPRVAGATSRARPGCPQTKWWS